MNDKEKNTLNAYVNTVNRIDEWLGDVNGVAENQEFIQTELDELTEKLLRIDRQAVRRQDIVPTIKVEMQRVIQTAKESGLTNSPKGRAQICETMRDFMFEFRTNNSLIQKFQVLCNEWNNEDTAGFGSIRMHVEIQFRGAKDTIRVEQIG